MHTVVGGIAGTAVGFIAMFVSVAAAGGGHGAYGIAKLLFPFSMAGTHWTDGITNPLIRLAMAQFPIYGCVLGWAFRSSRRSAVWGAAGVFHGVAVVVAFALSDPSFEP